MDGVCRPIGSPVPVVLDGDMYLLSPLTLGDFGTIENFMLAQRKSPLEVAMDAASRLDAFPDVKKQLMERAQRDMRLDRGVNKVRYGVSIDFLNRTDGRTLSAWLGLRRCHPVKFETGECARSVLERASGDERREFFRRRDMISGLDPWSWADWPARQPDDDDETDAASEGNEYRWIPWKRWVRELLTDYPGWSIADAASLTAYQARLMRAGKIDLGGRVRMTPAEYLAHKEFLRQMGSAG